LISSRHSAWVCCNSMPNLPCNHLFNLHFPAQFSMQIFDKDTGLAFDARPGADVQVSRLQQSLDSSASLVSQGLPAPSESETRFTYNKWRASLQRSRAPSPWAYRCSDRLRNQRTSSYSCPPCPNRHVVASCRASNNVGADFGDAPSITGGIVDCLGADAWLLVLLFSDTSAMSAAAVLDSSCAKARLLAGDGAEDNEMGWRLEQLAAWLRSGMSLTKEELPWCQLPHPPTQCHASWLHVLRQQEERALWICLLVINGQAEFVEDFAAGITLAAQRYCGGSGDSTLPAGSFGAAAPLIVILPSVGGHRSTQERITVTHPLSVLGLSVPLTLGQRRTVLWFGSLEVCTQGLVEFRNLKMLGSGTNSERPRGACDSVVRVTQGECTIADSEICIIARHVGFGVVVGRRGLIMGGLSTAPFSQPAPHVSLKNCRVSHCDAGCMVYLAGQLMVDSKCTFTDCRIGISACDRETQVNVKKEGRMFRRCGEDVQTLAGGVINFVQ